MNYTVEEWLGKDNQLGIDIWKKKYQYNNETFEHWLDRVSGNNANVKELIWNKKFLFGGRILSNRNVPVAETKSSLSNCYVITPPEDNIESIYETCSKLARTYSYGGGCGIDISKLSPEGATVRNQAKSTTGAVSFMDTFSQVTEQICQNGRRGALMISIDCKHPDLEKFITVKSDLNKVTSANISVRISDDFMKAVENDADWELAFYRPETNETISKVVKAKDIFNLLCKNNWDYAEPGMLFWDRISNYNMLNNNPEFAYAGTNPCVRGDTLVLTDKGYIPIEQLDGKTVNVWNGYEYSTVVPHKTGTNQKMLKITMSNSMSVDCTLYHKFLLKDGSRKEAQNLQIGDELPTWYSPDGIDSITNITVSKIEAVEDADIVYCMNESKNHTFIANGILVGNCAEEPLPAGGSCLLGSLNLAAFVDEEHHKFDYADFIEAVHTAVYALNDVLEEGLPRHPLQEQRDTVNDWRQIGLGILGLADMLIKLGITYGSDDAVALCDKIGTVLATEAIVASSVLADELGAYPKYNELIKSSAFFKAHYATDIEGLRNSQLLTIAPTGSISTMIGVSGGIEPIFANSYNRVTKSLHGHDEVYKVYTPIVADYIKAHKLKDDTELPEYFVTSADIPVENRIKMQSIWQKHIDASISSTINLPNEATIDDVAQLYMSAWKAGLKGVTVYRAGCAREGILVTDETQKAVEAKSDEPSWGSVMKCSDDLIGKKRKLRTGCGSLHCLAFFDPDSGKLMEVYLNKGSTGGCANFMTGLSRTISMLCRAGVDVYKIKDQLDSTGVCPSYATRKAVHGDTSKGSCCPMAVGNALIDMYKEVQDELHQIHLANIQAQNNSNKTSTKQLSEVSICPECGAELRFEGGCNSCPNCGWTKCE